MAMERAVANPYFALCFILAASVPTVNAFPYTYYQTAYFQQSTAIGSITEAIADAVAKAVGDAQHNIKTNLKSALTDLMRDKINSLNPYGDIDFDDRHIEFRAHPSSTVDLFQFLPLSSSVALPSISLEQLQYTFETSNLVVVTREYGSQNIIPDVLELQNIALSFNVGLQNPSTLVVNFAGDFVLGGVPISTEVIYTHASRNANIRAEISGLSINFQSVATQLVGLNLPTALHQSISIPTLVISGKVTLVNEESDLTVGTTGGNMHVYIIYKKTGRPRKAIAVEMSNIALASVLSDVAGLDISGIPYFGTAALPMNALTYATDNIVGLPEDIFANSPLLNALGNDVEKDLTALIKFSFTESPIKLHYSGSGFLTFSPAISGNVNLQSLISVIPSFNLNSIPFPPGISSLLSLGIGEFSLDLSKKTVIIAVSYPGSLTFLDGFLRVDNPMVKVEGPTGGIKIDIDGDLSISGTDFDVSIKRDEESGRYILRAQAKELPITHLISQFQSEVLPSELNSLLGSLPFFSFSIEDPSISFPLSSSPLQIQLGGIPVISGYSIVHMASVIIREGGKNLLVQGFELGSLNLASILKSITGFNFKSIAILNQNMEAAILISPMTLPNVHLSGDKLSGFSVTKGLSVHANMMFPPGCSSDAFCAVAQFLLGKDAQLNLQGTIASLTSFTLSAGVSNINLGSGIVMSQAGVEIKGGTTNSIGIVGAVDLSYPDITLAARVFLSTSGVVLEMTMSGCWENAFGASWLDICSLQSSVAMIPGVTLTGLALGGEVHIGDESCGTPLVATGFVGIDVVTPTNNYYYVNVQGSTTVNTILNALCTKVDIPAPLAESGFPRGFLSSFSLAGVELPHVPLSIPQGYRLNGTLNILGLEASADVTIGLPNGIDFAVALPPINVGGLLRMSVSSSDQSRGPFLKAVITLLPTPNVNIEARGYLSVLDISLETILTVTNTEYIFNIQGKMLNLFEANLHIAASYGNIQQARFQVQGSFTSTLYDDIENIIKNTLSSAGDEASSQLEAAQKELDRARGVLNSAKSALKDGQDKVDDAQLALDAAEAEVNRLKNKLDSVCSIKSGGTIEACVPCPKGTTCCGRIFGKCICYRPVMGTCCTDVPDPACQSANAACIALKTPIKTALEGAKGAVITARGPLEAAKAALIPLQAAVTAAQASVDAADQALEGVKAAFAVGLQAADAIANVGLNGLISIREISFSANLDVAAGGSFSGSVRARFAGAAQITVSININLHDITSMAKQLADHIGTGFSSLF